jgi:hypothetical protein
LLVLNGVTKPNASSDPFVAAAYTQYGATMLAVQVWEKELVTLAGAASLKAAGKKVSFEKALRRSFKETWKQMNKQKPSKLRKMLKEIADKHAITNPLIDEITDLNEWRNFLSHDYLRAKLPDGASNEPDPELVIELFQIGQAFSDCTQRMAEATKILLTGAPKSETVKQVRAVVERFTHDLPTTQPPPLATPAPNDEANPAASSIKLWQRQDKNRH